MKLTYTVLNAGWAEVNVREGDADIEMVASYLHDSLRDLAQAAVNLLQGVSEQRCVFMDEPGEHQFHLTKREDKAYTLQIHWYDDWESWGMHPPDQRDLVLDSEITSQDFASEVLSNLLLINKELGPEVYKKRWIENDFPTDLMLQLKTLVDA